MGLKRGEWVEFKPEKGKLRTGVIEKISQSRGQAMVKLDGDPFAVKVNISQLQSCTDSGNVVSSTAKVRKGRTPTQKEEESMPKSDAKELRKQAQSLGIKGWEEMGRDELREAVKAASAPKSKRRSSKSKSTRPAAKSKAPATKKRAPAKKAAPSKRAATKKAAAPKADASAKAEATYTDPPRGVKASDVENPFRSGSNLHKIFPILVPRGGKRRTLAERLQKKVNIHPYINDEGDVDLLDYDKRIVLAASTLRDKHGFAVERKGRGLDGTIRCFPPGSEHDPRGASANGASKSRKRARSKS